jgi:hypothetical protein
MSDNPALAELQFLAGDWDMELSGASFLPDPAAVVKASVTFGWIEAGAALVMRMGDAATWIIGRDEAEPEYHVLYSDDRGVSRVYRMTFSDRSWQLWRDAPGFAQRFQAQLSSDPPVIDGRWEKSLDGGASWEHDFNVRYTRPASS